MVFRNILDIVCKNEMVKFNTGLRAAGLFIFLMISANMFSQEIAPILSFSQIEKGNLSIDRLSISLEGIIHQVEIDSVNSIVFFNVEERRYTGKPRGEGRLYGCDWRNNKVLWTLPMYYAKNSLDCRIVLSPNQLIMISSSWAVALNHLTGEVLWSIEGSDFFLNPSGEMLLGKISSSEMAAWSPSTGRLLWRNVPSYNFQTIFFSNDSTLISWDKEFYRIDLRKGDFWRKDIKNRTYINSPNYNVAGAAIAGVFIGALTGLLTGAIIVTVPVIISGSQSSGNRSSHLVLEDDVSYIIDGRIVKKFDYYGRELWAAELTKGYSSNRVITATDGGILFASYGSTYNQDGVEVPQGISSCEIFDRSTGESKGHQILPTEGYDFLKDFVVHEDSVFFLGKRTLFTLDLAGVNIQKNRSFGNGYSNVGLSEFVDPSFYLRTDSSFMQIENISDQPLFIRNTASKVIEFNSSLEIMEVFSKSDFFENSDEFKSLTLLSNDQKSIIMDSMGVSVLNISFAADASFKNGFLIERSEDQIKIIRLKDLLE
jgi:outer membrane protein assembly factor BamB